MTGYFDAVIGRKTSQLLKCPRCDNVLTIQFTIKPKCKTGQHYPKLTKDIASFDVDIGFAIVSPEDWCAQFKEKSPAATPQGEAGKEAPPVEDDKT